MFKTIKTKLNNWLARYETWAIIDGKITIHYSHTFKDAFEWFACYSQNIAGVMVFDTWAIQPVVCGRRNYPFIERVCNAK